MWKFWGCCCRCCLGYRHWCLCSLSQVLVLVIMVGSLQGASWVLETQWRAEATCEVWVWSKDREEFPRVPCGSQWAQAGREWWLMCSSHLRSPSLVLQPLCFGLLVAISWSVLFLCLWLLSLSKMITSSLDGTGNGFNCTRKAWDKCFHFLSDGSQWHFHTHISYLLSQKAGSGSLLLLFSTFQLNSHQSQPSSPPAKTGWTTNYLCGCWILFLSYVWNNSNLYICFVHVTMDLWN